VPGKGQIKPIIERDLDLVRSLGVLIENAPLPSLYTIHDLNDYSQKSQPVLTIGLGASRKTKMWPIINYREIAIKWNLITGGSVVLVVGNNEEELIDQFQKAGPKLLFIRVEKGRPLKELSAILKSSDLFLGNDSGPRHLAAALGTKTVTVFGPEDPYEWHPYPIERHPFHFIENLNCREDAPKGFPAWCGIEDCVKQSHRCMRSISVEQVFDSCIKMAGLLK
jgi:ADP-heptose:LPS heptosyltransferase